MCPSGRFAAVPPMTAAAPLSSPSSPTTVVVASAGLGAKGSLEQCFSEEAGFILVRCPEAIDEVLSCCCRLAPFVLVVDQAFVERMEPSQVERIVHSGRSTRVLVIGRSKDDAAVEGFLRMGCDGYLHEDSAQSVLRRAVKCVALGELWASRRVVSRMVREVLSAGNLRQLTRRETEILCLVGRGCKNQEIAQLLFISRETVRWHLRSLYAKIGVQDRLSAAFYAAETYPKQPHEFVPRMLPEGLREPKHLATSTR